MGGVIRPRKDGNGCSICRAQEKNVGKRRCCHVLSNAQFIVRQEKGSGTKFIDISGDVEDQKTSFSIKATEESIKSYISSLSNGLSKKEKENVLHALRDM